MSTSRNYENGRAAEYRVMAKLRGVGYTVARMAGSHGVFDVIAWDTAHVRMIQVKSGAHGATPADREAIAEMRVPPGVTKELWTLKPRQPAIVQVFE